MFDKILIANRGEIALRIIRACKELGVKTTTVFSEADRRSLHVRYADEAYLLGPPPPAESYLNINKIIEIALKAGVEAVHSGYGFLAENSEFAAGCEKNNLVFIGPSSGTLKLTGNKLECRRKMKQAGVPVIAGGDDVVSTVQEASAIAETVGFPVLLKSVFGGGGRGIRVANTPAELSEVFEATQREALLSFGRFGVYVEKLLASPRHIEFQILSDEKGNVVHLGERECSIQRRFQKLVEISPSPVVDASTRERVGELAVRAAKTVSYRNAGTVEFIVNGKMQFYFIEMNSRLQVEHPVTELVAGLDLVKTQLRIACGEGLDFDQSSVHLTGCAIECRINAEDPYNDFLPSAGVVSSYHPPSGPGVRVDSALYSGCEVPIYYDSLVAKLVAHGGSFEEARVRMRNALTEYVIEGIATTMPLHQAIIANPYFAKGAISTSFIQDRLPDFDKPRNGPVSAETEELAVMAAAIHLLGRVKAPKPLPSAKPSGSTGWRGSYAHGNPQPSTSRFADDF